MSTDRTIDQLEEELRGVTVDFNSTDRPGARVVLYQKMTELRELIAAKNHEAECLQMESVLQPMVPFRIRVPRDTPSPLYENLRDFLGVKKAGDA